MRLSHVLNTKGHLVHTASPGDTIMDVIGKLVSHNIGALAVVDPHGSLVGIISERDILRLLARDAASLTATKVAQRMTTKVLTASPEDEVDNCLNAMTEHRVRHLPVCIDGKLAGMVSIGDLVKIKLEDAVFETKHLTAFVMGQYPA